MPEKKTGLQKGYRCLNYVRSNVSVNPDEIPNMIPEKYLNEWQKDDPNPYYKTQVIEYPILSNRLNYQESFFESFISKLKERAIPGSKDGHSIYWSSRPDTDFIMIGAKIDSNGDGTGKVFFKNYIPPKGEKGSNENFIIENKTDMVHYSLVTYPREERYEDDEGNTIINIIESIKGERNDAVEYGLGAMKQITNQKDLEGLSNLESDSANIIDNQKEGEEILTKDELLKKINTLKANAELTLPEVAEAMGLKNQVVTEEHSEALKIVNSIKELGLKNPIADIKVMQSKIEADAEAVLNARLDKEYGTNPDSEKNDNFLRKYAGQEIANMEGDDLDVKINALKKDPIALKFAKEKTDYNTDDNTIVGFVETNKKKEPVKSGHRIDKV